MNASFQHVNSQLADSERTAAAHLRMSGIRLRSPYAIRSTPRIASGCASLSSDLTMRARILDSRRTPHRGVS